MDQRDLGSVGRAGEHRFPEEHPSERDAVEPARQLAVDPGLDRVCVPGAVKAPRTPPIICGVIQVPSWPSRGAAQARMTAPKAVSARTS